MTKEPSAQPADESSDAPSTEIEAEEPSEEREVPQTLDQASFAGMVGEENFSFAAYEMAREMGLW